MKLSSLLSLCLLIAGACCGADLTGNWVASKPLGDGTSRRTYFDLKEANGHITGFIRTTQFHYTITESTGNSDSFTIIGSMQDGNNLRHVTYEGKLTGDELHLTTRRHPQDQPTEMVAHPAPQGEGAMPKRIPPPALHTVPSNHLAKTPPMGWNSWNKFASRVDDAGIRRMADVMVSSGMKAAGYVYVNIDDTWQGARDAQGNIHPNNKFPDMKALAAYVHGKGLKLGIYSSPGPNTCAGYEGSYGHEAQDARTYAAWGIDYLKYDWCGARNIYPDQDMQAVYQKMGQALRDSGRRIIYSLCQYGRDEVWKWGPDVDGNSWRTTGDINDSWASMSKIGFSQSDLASWAGPGHWNDPDMLEVGNGGMSDVEYTTHMSLWSMLAAPLLAGNDLANMTKATHDILTNREVIAIDQDPAGKQGKRAWKEGDQEIWTRELADGSVAVGLFNRSADPAKIAASWKDLGLNATPKKARDLWRHEDVTLTGPEYAAMVPGHGVVLLRVTR